MSIAALVYPHQLYDDHPAIIPGAVAVLIEEPLFFTQYRFHRQKLIFHRVSMARYAEKLRRRGTTVRYLDVAALPHTAAIADHLLRWGVQQVRVVDPCDDWLDQRLMAGLRDRGLSVQLLPDPHFLTPPAAIARISEGPQKLYFTRFYIEQRKRLGILLDNGQPVGGKWSFDPENRKKLPRHLPLPTITRPREDDIVRHARQSVRCDFPEAIGDDEPFAYPTDHTTAAAWLAEFLATRLPHFGDYEDAISTQHTIVFHSVLTPLLNTGLLSPQQVVDAALQQADRVPLNSLEGFLRQLIGWREFIRVVYRTQGRKQRSRNFWNHTQPMPRAFYDGTTGIPPVDHVIRQVLRTGYCHHIERLMILGNFMLLCAIHPDAVYQWFMELFIDAYDWVMVPNVYGMSQHADGGLMTTKPYISGSNYIRTMSDFPPGPWCAIWDALYWRFIDRHTDFFANNPRMAVMVRRKDQLGKKLADHHRRAEQFLDDLYKK
ncbi:MAG: cryptochrome/photolyase family protein [Gemmataceae bacterium]|nr:cryptochrome/photolyase family protein [Gemmata sp.]MDW8197128.1 cryptochrome/photolyase family protein [Gemmataceae bacterium]